MKAWLIALALQASPAPVLQPDPGGWKRLQPRQLDASSFLANGWNRFEQNYLPLYAADDDATTAWVEGAKGPGIGERLSWYGPRLAKARAFRIFVRAGYQKSRTLFDANVRPRRVRFEPLAPAESGALPGGKPVEVELDDALGWQKVELPVPNAVSGFQLTVLSVYPGTKYEDLCISDLQVYVDGDDVYSAPGEQAAADRIRSAVAERKAAAVLGTQASVELKPHYTERPLGSLKLAPSDPESGAPASMSNNLAQPGGQLEPILARARAALAAYQGVPVNTIRKQPVRVASTAPGLGNRATALAAAARRAPGFAKLLRYLAIKDFAIFESTGADHDPDTTAYLALSGLFESHDPSCAAKCKPMLAKLGKAGQNALGCFVVGADAHGAKDCQEMCAGDEIPCDSGSTAQTRGSYAIGSLASPSDLFWQVETVSGDRDTSTDAENEFLAYQDGLASSLVSMHTSDTSSRPWQDEQGSVYLFDWDRAGALPLLTRVTRVEVGAKQIRISAFEAA